MLDSLFLETFSIPIIITLILMINNYLEFALTKEIKIIVIFLLTTLFLILFDRLDYLDNKDEQIAQKCLFVLLFISTLYYTIINSDRYLKYFIIILIIVLFSFLINFERLELELEFFKLLGIIAFVYMLLKGNKNLAILSLFFIIVLVIDSPIDFLSV